MGKGNNSIEFNVLPPTPTLPAFKLNLHLFSYGGSSFD